MIEFRCTKCSQKLSIADSAIGKKIACPKCKSDVIVPASVEQIRKDGQTLSSTVKLEGLPALERKSRGPAKTSFRRYLVLGSMASAFVFIATWWKYYSAHRSETETANAHLSEAVADAKLWLGGEQQFTAEEIENILNSALSDKNVSDKSGAFAVLIQVQRKKNQLLVEDQIKKAALVANEILVDAKIEIEAGNTNAAIELLRIYINHPHAQKKDEAQKQLLAIEKSIADALAAELKAMAISDNEFDNGPLQVQTDEEVVYIPKNGNETRWEFIRIEFQGQQSTEGFFNLNGRAARLNITSSDPTRLRIDLIGEEAYLSKIPVTSQLGEQYTFLKEGEVVIVVTVGPYSRYRLVKIVEIPFPTDEPSSEVVKVMGLPDSKKTFFVSWPDLEEIDGIIYDPGPGGAASGEHWRYRRFPGLVISIMNGSVYKIASCTSE